MGYELLDMAYPDRPRGQLHVKRTYSYTASMAIENRLSDLTSLHLQICTLSAVVLPPDPFAVIKAYAALVFSNLRLLCFTPH